MPDHKVTAVGQLFNTDIRRRMIILDWMSVEAPLAKPAVLFAGQYCIDEGRAADIVGRVF